MPDKSPKEICVAIALDFKRRKISHQEAAEQIGKTKASISNQISGKKPFSKGMAELFASAFNYNVDFLLYGKGDLLGIDAKDFSKYTVSSIDADNLDASLLPHLIEAADSIIHLSNNELAIDTWNALIMGDFEGYKSKISDLSNDSPSRPISLVSAKILCTNIKKILGEFVGPQERL